MKVLKNISYWFLMLFFSLIGIWMIPLLVKKITVEPEKYPFLYYSSIAKELCIVDYNNKETPLKQIDGKAYRTVAEADSVLLFFKYRQLMSEGRMPDSIAGQPLTMQTLRAKSIVYQFEPKNRATPQLSLYIMYEAMPKRVGIVSPGDVFRLKENIEFIDIETNSVNQPKSDLFQTALTKAGFQFPAQWVNGNMNPRKPYDEGYFVLDAQGELFHLKMVNGRPFVKNTNIGKQVKVAWFEMLEVADKRLYGFLYDTSGNIYIIGNEGGQYDLLRLDIDPLNLKTDKVTILGNMLDWTVSVTRPNGKDYYGLDMQSLKRLSQYQVKKTSDLWSTTASFLFPFYISFEDEHTDFIEPNLHFTAIYGFVFNLILALLFWVISKDASKQKNILTGWIVLFGIAGFIASLILQVKKK